MPELFALHDPAVLSQLKHDTDATFLQEALAQFRKDLAAFVVGVGPAAAGARKRMVHTMGSSAGLMGASRLAQACFALEANAYVSDEQARALAELARLTDGVFAAIAEL